MGWLGAAAVGSIPALVTFFSFSSLLLLFLSSLSKPIFLLSTQHYFYLGVESQLDNFVFDVLFSCLLNDYVYASLLLIFSLKVAIQGLASQFVAVVHERYQKLSDDNEDEEEYRPSLSKYVSLFFTILCLSCFSRN